MVDRHPDALRLIAMVGIGLALPLGTALAGADLITTILLVALWSIAPTALYATFPPSGSASYAGLRSSSASVLRRLWVVLPVAAATTSVGLLLSPSVLAVALTLPWLLTMATLGLICGLRLLQHGIAPIEERAADIGWLFTAVGAGWLVAATAPTVPLPFSRTITRLTAAHFHVGSLTLGIGLAGLGRLLRVASSDRTARLHAVATGGYVIGFGLVAAGITGSRPLELIGTLILAAAVLLLSGLLFRSVGRTWPDTPIAASGLLVATVGAPVGIGLALVYAWGRWPGPATLTIPTMVQYHGLLNTFGVALPLLGAIAYVAPAPRPASVE